MYDALRTAWDELTSPGAPFEVGEIEVRGVRVRAFLTAPATLREFWLGSRVHGSADYLVYEEERWDYDRAHREVGAIAAWLVEQGVVPGDRVAIAMRNYPEWLLFYWATVSIGAVAVGMNAWWTSDEMRFALRDASPKIIACDEERLARLLPIREDVPPNTVVTVRCTTPLPPNAVPFASLITDRPLPECTIDPDSDACLFYTSGTTGEPKGAQLTHRSCTNNLYSVAFWGTAQARARKSAGQSPSAGAPPPSLQMCNLLTTPLFHVTANNCGAHTGTASGGKLVLMYKWDAAEALRLIERERVTTFGGVPTMARELLAHPDLERRDTSSLNLIGGGGAKFQSDLVRKVEGRPGRTRTNTGYGLTETSGIITANSGDFLADKPESVGPVMPCFEARCVDDDGRDVEEGQPGELWVKGAQVIAGYWNRPEATAEAITDGWFHTGDIAVIDSDGFIEIVDRKKDMVLRGGENVYCSEIESVLFGHPAVAECAVFGVPDERLGEEVGAAIVVHEGTAETFADFREHCGGRLAAYKVPRYIWILREALPRNANGKFVKRELRAQLDPADAG